MFFSLCNGFGTLKATQITFFDEKGKFYRFTVRGIAKPLLRTVKRYTQGYTLKSRFYSLAQLRPLLKRYNPISYPMDF
ncbi:MAG: hypothetical protein H7319_09635 [Spirosoma sp.]|nr:hypothetical protein [Spirosoma sp.]